jgi:hypothetical protein
MMGDNNSGSYPNIVISPFTHLERNFNSSATRKEQIWNDRISFS